MPQMAPYNWFLLFLLFNMIMYFYMMINHYTQIYFTNKILIKNNKKFIFNFWYLN